MYFRFGSALVLVVLISLAGTMLEKENLAFRREVSQQHYRLQLLKEQQAIRRVQAEQWSAPLRMVETLPAQAAPLEKKKSRK